MVKYILVLQLLLITLAGHAADFPDRAKPIDKELVRKLDVTGDGKQEIISLHIRGKNFHSPFTWTIAIASEGEKIFTITRNDTWMDQNFNDQGFVSECDDYISCKERWYFKSILESLIVPKTMYNLEGILEKNQPNRMYAVGRKYLANCCGIRGEKAVAILTTVENRLRAGRAVVVSIPVSPVKGDSPMVFVPEVGRFMPIYEE